MFNSRLSEPVCRAVRESEKSKCKISMFCGTVGTDCPYVTHTHHQSSGKRTHVPGFHFAIFPCWTCQRNFAASPYTSAKNVQLNLSQMDFPHVWALIKEEKQRGGGGGGVGAELLARNVSVEAFARAAVLPVRSVCSFLQAGTGTAGADPVLGYPPVPCRCITPGSSVQGSACPVRVVQNSLRDLSQTIHPPSSNCHRTNTEHHCQVCRIR